MPPASPLDTPDRLPPRGRGSAPADLHTPPEPARSPAADEDLTEHETWADLDARLDALSEYEPDPGEPEDLEPEE